MEHAQHTGVGAGSGRDAGPDCGLGTWIPDAAVGLAQRGVQALLGAELEELSDRALLEHTVAVDRLVTQLEAHRARSLRAVDARQAFKQDGCVTAGSWLRQRTRRDPAEASRIARAARRLGWLDDTRKAYEAGEISSGHVEQIARTATPRRRQAIIDHEATLVDLARQDPPANLARACRRIADLVDRDGSDGARGPDPRRKLYHSQTYDGMWDLHATLDPVTGERLHHLILAFLPKDDPQFEAVDRRTPPQQRHDAFDLILKAAEEHPDLPSVHGAKPHVLLTIDLAALTPVHTLADTGDNTDDNDVRRGGGAGPGEVSHGAPLRAPLEPRLGSGTRLSLHQAVDLLQGAKLTPILQMGPYRPVALGRTHRVLPAWLRPLLPAIHLHCRGPGCDRPISWTQAAHSEDAWEHGGDTDFEETLPLCTAHHKLVDEDGWSADLDPATAIVTWTSPDRTTTVRTHPPP